MMETEIKPEPQSVVVPLGGEGESLVKLIMTQNLGDGFHQLYAFPHGWLTEAEANA